MSRLCATELLAWATSLIMVPCCNMQDTSYVIEKCQYQQKSHLWCLVMKPPWCGDKIHNEMISDILVLKLISVFILFSSHNFYFI